MFVWNFPSVKTFALTLSINTLKLVNDKHVKQWNSFNTFTCDKIVRLNIFFIPLVLSHSILTFILLPPAKGVPKVMLSVVCLSVCSQGVPYHRFPHPFHRHVQTGPRTSLYSPLSYMFKLVHYVAHASVRKWAVGIPRKCLLVY